MTNDICDIRTVIDVDAPNWQEGSKIYEDGRNSQKSDGSTRTLQGGFAACGAVVQWRARGQGVRIAAQRSAT